MNISQISKNKYRTSGSNTFYINIFRSIVISNRNFTQILNLIIKYTNKHIMWMCKKLTPSWTFEIWIPLITHHLLSLESWKSLSPCHLVHDEDYTQWSAYHPYISFAFNLRLFLYCIAYIYLFQVLCSYCSIFSLILITRQTRS